MALTDIAYDVRAKDAGLNVYFIAEADADGNSRLLKNVPANPTCNAYSIAKAFTVLAVGQCFDKGLLNPSMRVSDVLGSFIPTDADEKWKNVTLHDVLTHRIGYGEGLLDIDAEDPLKWGSKDYLSLAFRAPLVHEPGMMRQYTDAAYYIASRMVSRVTGQTLADFLRPTLLDTMDFREMAWSACPQGYSMGATGLYVRTDDMVKLGVLWLRGGDWFGKRVVSETWVDTVINRGYEFVPKLADATSVWYGKGGMRGQMLTFNLKKGLAVAWNAYGKVPFDAMIN